VARATTGALLAACLVSGCGGGSGTGSQADRTVPPVLAGVGVPGLRHRDTALSADVLARDVGRADGLGAKLSAWGFLAGRQREFTGTTRTLTDVVSRTLDFRTEAGAAAYVAFVRAHPGTFVGGVGTVGPLRVGARRGFLMTALGCGCHRETPLLLAVVRAGGRVTYLLANGPRATPARVAALVRRAP
jgi:hypothetical protein